MMEIAAIKNVLYPVYVIMNVVVRIAIVFKESNFAVAISPA